MLLALVTVSLALSATPVAADPIVVPTGLNPGDQYRLAFVTSTTGVATSTDIADYNSFVTAAANLEPLLIALGTTWNVIGSTRTVDARDNTSTNPTAVGVPMYLVNDTKLADNNADLWDGSLDVPFNVNENGDTITGFAFTGTTTDGTPSNNPRNSLGFNGVDGIANSVWLGDSRFAGITWTIGDATSDQTTTLPFRAMSGVLTVVPEPGSLILMSIGAVGLISFGRRRRRVA
jgi:hypothetical protein